MRRNARSDACAVLDRHIANHVDRLLDIAASTAEHPADPQPDQAWNATVANLDRLVRLRAGLGAWRGQSR